MASILSFDERPVTAVRLAGSILVETGQGEVEGKLGDYLVVTTAGRQVVMSDEEYRSVTSAPDLDTSLPPPVDVARPETNAKKDLFGSIFKKRESAQVGTGSAKRKFPGFTIFGKTSKGTEAREPPANTNPLDSDPTVDGLPEESSICTSGLVDIPEDMPNPGDIQSKQPELGQSSDQIESKYTEEVMTNLPDDENCHNLPLVAAVEPVLLIDFPQQSQKKTPPVEYDPRADPENLVIPRREPGAFLKFMRPGSGATKKLVVKREKKSFAFASAFKKRPKVLEPEPIKDRWPTVEPEWI